MKEIVIISCWPNNEYKEKLLIDLINKLKQLNKEILIASHYVIPSYITNMVDYYIYDKTNTIYTNKTLETYTADFYFKHETFKIEAVNIDHGAALSRIFNIALNFIKNLKYDYFTIIEADVEFDINDLKKLNDIKLNLIKNNKKLFFFKIRPYEFPFWEDNGIFEVYATFCFGGFLKEFNSKFTFPKTLDEWNQSLLKDKNNHLFEYLVTEAFKKYKEDYYILDSIFYEFNNSKINTSSIFGLDGIYVNPKDENNPVLFFHNESDQIRTYKIFSPLSQEVILDPDGWWFTSLDASIYSLNIKITIYEEDKIIKNLDLLINKEWISREKNRRQFFFK